MMANKKLGKLVLARETVRKLSGAELSAVGGGGLTLYTKVNCCGTEDPHDSHCACATETCDCVAYTDTCRQPNTIILC